jgi:hypothetical protein
MQRPPYFALKLPEAGKYRNETAQTTAEALVVHLPRQPG